MKLKTILNHSVNYQFVFLFVLLGSTAIRAQIQNKERLFINDNTAFHIATGSYSFASGSTITTRTKGNHGLLSFGTNANWTAASDNHYVDGYVRFFGREAFVFPIGQSGVFAPVLVNPSAAEGVEAAYYRDNPTVIGRSLEETLAAISGKEYWDIRSESSFSTAVEIELSWRSTSEIAILTSNEIADLTIVGWNGKKWIPIPSYVDSNSIMGEESTLMSGSISSDASIDLSRYSYFTLGSKVKVAPLEPIRNTIAYINKSTLSVQAGSGIRNINIYDIGGKNIISYAVAGKFNYTAAFYYAEAVYVATIIMDNGRTISIKLINKL